MQRYPYELRTEPKWNCKITLPKLPRLKRFIYNKHVTKVKVRKGVIRKLDLALNDIVVLTFPHRMGAEEVFRCKELFCQAINLESNRVVIVDSDPSIEVLHRV